jgi:hypothetical protein
MENLYVPKTIITPAIIFSTNGKLFIWGRSFQVFDGENTVDYYTSLRERMNEYCLDPAASLEIFIGIEIITGMEQRNLLEILRKAIMLQEKNFSVIINWYYEHDDTDMKEKGEGWSEQLDFSFNLIEIESIEAYFGSIVN